MSYEYLYSQVEKLRDKPFRADDFMRKIEELGLKPLVVTVDNVKGSVIMNFTERLNAKEKRTLDEGMKEIFKAW